MKKLEKNNEIKDLYEEGIEIYEDKAKTTGLFFLYLMITSVVLIIGFIRDTQTPSISILILIISVIEILFFGFCIVFIFTKLLKKEPV